MSLGSPDTGEGSTVLIIEADGRLRTVLRAQLRAAGYAAWAGKPRPAPADAGFDERLEPDPAEAGPAPGAAGVALALIGLDPVGSPAARAALALARALASLHKPVVFCAGCRSHDDEREGQAIALAHGAFAYFVKPVEPALLVRCLPAWLARAADLQALRRERGSLVEALRASRVVGTAVGILSERHRLTPEQAFDDLRRSARAERRALTEQARRVASGPLPTGA